MTQTRLCYKKRGELPRARKISQMAQLPRLTIRSLRTASVSVPMKLPLGTSAATVRTAPLLLLDLETEEGVTGRTYLFCYMALGSDLIARALHEILSLVRGERVDPVEIGAKLLRQFRLIGAQGVIWMAMAGLDVACWDALAQAAGMPLVAFLGGTPKQIPAYNSNGLGLMSTAACADEAEKLLDGGFRGIKLRLGYPTLEEDLAAVRSVRKRVPSEIAIMTDHNQALSVDEALNRGRALDTEGLAWIEEPIRHDDYAGCAAIARALATPVQIGENFIGVHALESALAANSADLMMPDLCRIGGVTGWQQAAALAAGKGIKLSSHLFPEVSSHLLAVTPTRHWLEYVDWASPILAEPIQIVDGTVTPSNRPGTGILWNQDAVEHYLMT
jgi:mandelate racemase